MRPKWTGSTYCWLILLLIIHANFLHSIKTCGELCHLCIDSGNELCRSSFIRLLRGCMDDDLSLNSDCTSTKHLECLRNFAIVEQLLYANDGYWCEKRDVYNIQKPHVIEHISTPLLNACVKVLHNGNFLQRAQAINCFSTLTPPNVLPISSVNSFDLLNDFLKEEAPKVYWKRTTRSPDRIQRWKSELSTELASFNQILPAVSCNVALYELCLSHISCRELWKIFRQSCVVDAQNQCEMTNRHDCWQSFEGISWTGLGSCGCFDNNSDCQFIRFLTNYNKCIYEIRASGDVPLPLPTAQLSQPFTTSATLSLSPSHITSQQRFIDVSGTTTISPARYIEWRTNELVDRSRFDTELERKRVEEVEAERRERLRVEEQKRLIEAERKQLQDALIQEQQKRHQIEQQRQTDFQEYERRYREQHAAMMIQRNSLPNQQQPRLFQSKPASQRNSRFNHPSFGSMLTPVVHRYSSFTTTTTPLTATPPYFRSTTSNHQNGRSSQPTKPTFSITARARIHDHNENDEDINDLLALTTENPILAATTTVSVMPITKEEQGKRKTKKPITHLSTSTPLTTTPTIMKSSTSEEPSATTTTTTTEESRTTSTTSKADTITTKHEPIIKKTVNISSTIKPKSRGRKLMKLTPGKDSSNVRKLLGNRIGYIVSRKSPYHSMLTRRNPNNLGTTDDEDGKLKESTCQAAYRRCEEDSETCRWHLSELQIKCPSDNRRCAREQCAKAVGRFARYVARPMVESLMFCQCAFGDGECKHLQWMYPRCLYSFLRNKPRWTCTQAVKLCESDALCFRQLKTFNSSCLVASNFGDIYSNTNSSAPKSVSKENAGGQPEEVEELVDVDDEMGAECVAERMDECRAAVIGIRGSYLEAPCYCGRDDFDCLEKQNMILPNNPCIEAAMVDYTVSYLSSNLKSHSRSSSDNKGNSSASASAEVTLLPPEMDAEDEAKEQYTIVNETGQEEETIDDAQETQINTNASSSEVEKELVESQLLSPIAGNSTTVYNQTSTVEITQPDDEMPTRLLTTTSKAATTSRRPLSTNADADDRVVMPTTKKNARILKLKESSFPKGALATQRPPPEGGCTTRNIDGEWITHYKDSVFREYDDWSGRCSSWCECSRRERLQCHELGCLSDMHCEALHTTVSFGERLYLEGRGACQCESGKFICDTSEDFPQLTPGLYISLGYSKEELALIRQKVPKASLEKSGLVSPSSSVAKDIASRLQFALERVVPKGMLCRIAVLEHFAQESVIMYQVQWYGIDRFANQTQPKWHVGRVEKTCSPFVKELEHNFLLERADRYQLVLSTIKQLRVIDLLDALPPAAQISGAASTTRHYFLTSFFIAILNVLRLADYFAKVRM